MKTNEEKLLILLQVAVENDWNIHLKRFMNNDFKVWCLNDNFYTYSINGQAQSPKSLNDLVTNFEEGEVSFIEALIKAKPEIEDEYVLHTHNPFHICLIILYVTIPTSKRLDWLFETFSHLLH